MKWVGIRDYAGWAFVVRWRIRDQQRKGQSYVGLGCSLKNLLERILHKKKKSLELST